MNTTQRHILWTGCAIMLLMGLFPPVEFETFRPPWSTAYNEEIPAVSTEYQYRFVLDQTRITLDETGASSFREDIAWARLRLQGLLIFSVVFLLLALFRDEEDQNGNKGFIDRVGPLRSY